MRKTMGCWMWPPLYSSVSDSGSIVLPTTRTKVSAWDLFSVVQVRINEFGILYEISLLTYVSHLSLSGFQLTNKPYRSLWMKCDVRHPNFLQRVISSIQTKNAKLCQISTEGNVLKGRIEDKGQRLEGERRRANGLELHQKIIKCFDSRTCIYLGNGEKGNSRGKWSWQKKHV